MNQKTEDMVTTIPETVLRHIRKVAEKTLSRYTQDEVGALLQEVLAGHYLDDHLVEVRKDEVSGSYEVRIIPPFPLTTIPISVELGEDTEAPTKKDG